MLRLVVSLLLCGLLAGAPVRKLDGKVVRVIDGDTIDLLVDRRPVRIRLYGIDAPERGQPFGTVARRQLGDWIANQHVRAVVIERDRYGRFVARIQYKGKDISQEMVRAGLAWWYRAHAERDRPLRKLEQQARERKRGLWSQPAVPPWDWRRN